MKPVSTAAIIVLGGIAAGAGGSPVTPASDLPIAVHLAGNTSSNSSSNTSSNSGARGSVHVHTHDWTIETERNGSRQTMRGSTRIEGYAPDRRRRPNAVYEHFRNDD